MPGENAKTKTITRRVIGQKESEEALKSQREIYYQRVANHLRGLREIGEILDRMRGKDNALAQEALERVIRLKAEGRYYVNIHADEGKEEGTL